MTNRAAVVDVLRSLPGPKVTIYGRRIHHGAFGCWLIAVGLLLALHDRRDFPWKFR